MSPFDELHARSERHQCLLCLCGEPLEENDSILSRSISNREEEHTAAIVSDWSFQSLTDYFAPFTFRIISFPQRPNVKRTLLRRLCVPSLSGQVEPSRCCNRSSKVSCVLCTIYAPHSHDTKDKHRQSYVFFLSLKNSVYYIVCVYVCVACATRL